MWGNLADKLGAKDINSTLQKIGNAVAPPPGHYDDDDDYDDEYDDEYDEEGSYEDDEEDTNIGGLGFVGMLTRALDNQEEDEEEEEEEEFDFAPPPRKAVPKPVVPPALLPSQRTTTSLSTTTSTISSDMSKRPLHKKDATSEEAKDNAPNVAVLDMKKKLQHYRKQQQQSSKEQVQQPINSTPKLDVSKPKREARSERIRSLEQKPPPPPVPKAKESYPKRSTTEPPHQQPKQDRPTTIQEGSPIVPQRPKITVSNHASSPSLPKKTAAKVEVPKNRPSAAPMQPRQPVITTDVIPPNDVLEVGNSSTDLQRELEEAREKIRKLQKTAREQQQQSERVRENLLVEFQEKEVRVLQATSEEHHQEMLQLEQSLKSEIHSLTEKMANDRNEFVREQERYRDLIDQSESRAEKAETDLKKLKKRQENELSQSQQREERSIMMAEDKVAQTMARLDERNSEIAKLKNLIRTLESKMNEHQEGAEEAEEEVQELETENETLQEHIETLESECADLKSHIKVLEANASKFGGMQMELTMMKEELNREKTKNESAVQSAMSSNNQIELERDEARSEVRDVKQQLTAALADLEIAKADVSRMTTANNNLQSALEAFQDERQAEMDLLDEQRKESEEALSCAHDAKMDALRQTYNTEMKQVQKAADMAVKNSMNEVTLLEVKIENLRSENNQMRRSLDEAIHRLQTTQEDVIDRTLMKNILLDWCTMKNKQKRQQVLELMANVLHFSEDEREKVNLTHMDIESVRSRVVGALAPIPPSKTDVENLQGDNVREKFLNFMLAETEDGF